MAVKDKEADWKERQKALGKLGEMCEAGAGQYPNFAKGVVNLKDLLAAQACIWLILDVHGPITNFTF